MRILAAFLSLVVFALVAAGQNEKAGKAPAVQKPACSRGAICFSGQVSAGQEFRTALNSDIDFLLKPAWTIAIVPKRAEAGCDDFASPVNPPYRAHRSLYIDTSYGWSAEEEVRTSPREFKFVTNCADYRTESQRLDVVLWPYTATQQKYNEALAQLGSSPLGTGRLWITSSGISHAHDTADNKLGTIDWMSFSVEITIPAHK